MSDTLEIFGTEYQNVAGFKATDSNSQTKTYIRPQGTKSISANGTNIDVTAYAAVDVSVSGGSPNLQTKSKSYTPTETAQSETVSADSGYDGLDSVSISVGAIDSMYVGSDIAHNDSTDLQVNGAVVVVPAGYYDNIAGAQVASGTATPAASITATGATVSTGTNTLTLSKSSVSNTPQVTAGYVSSGTAGNSSVSLTASVTTKGATTYRASTSQQTIASGTYLTGTQTIAAVSQTNLSAENIKSGTTISISNGSSNIWSVTGSYTGGGSVSVETKTVTNNDNTATSISFTSLKGTPKYWFLKLNTQVSSSGSTSYYYVVDMRYNGTNTYGNCFRIGSTRRVDHITSGYSGSYSGTTMTISTTGSRTASPGSFYNGTYELTYIY